MIRSSPAPYICTTAETSSSASSRRNRFARRLQGGLELLNPFDELLRSGRVARACGVHVRYAIAVGVCITFRTLPPPVYM